MTKSTLEDPWRGVERSRGRWVGRRMEIEHLLSPFWAVHPNGHPGLVIRDVPPEALPRELPRPKGIRVDAERGTSGSVVVTMFVESVADREIFHQLCRDIVAASADAATAVEATHKLFGRLGRWQSLLGFARGTTLSDEEVRGLIGELWMLTEQIQPRLGIAQALRSWVAAKQHPQDFSLSTGLLEVKTRVSGARREVHISSLDQLDGGEVPLYLAVVELMPVEAVDNSLSLNDLVECLLAAARGTSEEVALLAEEALHGWGFVASPHYDHLRYTVAGSSAYSVAGGFPRLMRRGISEGIRDASYILGTDGLEEYSLDLEKVIPEATTDTSL